MIRSRKMLKREGDSRHPCLTPTVVLNHSGVIDINPISFLSGLRYGVFQKKGQKEKKIPGVQFSCSGIPSEILVSFRQSAPSSSYPLQNSDTVRDISTKLGTNIKHYQTMCGEQRP